MAEQQTLGYVALQVVPSFRGITTALQQGLTAPIVAAGQRAGQESGRAVASGLDAAVADVSRASSKLAAARNKEEDAAGKIAIAEQKLQELRDKGNASASQIMAAEERVRIARRNGEQATNSARSALQDLTEARAREANAARDGEQATDDYSGSLDSMGSSLMDQVKNLAGVAVAFAGVGSAADLMFQNIDNEAVFAKMNASLGASPAMAQEYSAMAGDLYRQGWGESLDDVAASIAAVSSTFTVAGFEGERAVDAIAASAMDFATVFDQDVAESVQTANQLIVNGLASDSEEAFDLMTASFQRVPAAMRDEIPELINEYGTFFSSMGFNGQEAFGMLVNVSDQGKIAMDKVGDSLKEVGIRATDLGDKGAIEALDSLGLAGENIQERLLQGGDAAKTAFQQMTGALVGIKDPAEQAALATALFGTPLEDLNKAEIPAFLEAMNTAGDGMAGFEGSSQQLSDTINGTAAVALESFTRTVKGEFADALGEAAKFLMENADTIKTVGIVLAPVAAAVGLYALTVKTMAVAQAAWTAVMTAGSVAQWALNAAMAANPIGLIVVGVVALGAALVLAWQKSETFRNVVMGAWQGIQDAASFAWNSILKPAFDGFMGALGWIGDKALWLYNAAILPAWNGISSVIGGIWNGFIRPMFDNFLILMGLMGDAATWFYQNAILPAWNGISSAVSTVWDTVLSPIFGFFGAAFDKVGAAASWFYDNAIRPAFDGVKSAVEGAWNFIQPIFGWIEGGIDGIGSVASGIGGAMKDAFDGVVDVIKAPLRLIGQLLEKIPHKIGPFTVPGAESLNRWGRDLQALRAGGEVAGRKNGWLTGPGTGTSDSILGVNAWGAPTALVSSGEFVVNAKASKTWGPVLQMINSGVPRFAEGGMVGAEDLNQFARGVEGAPYVWGGVNWGDCSGAVSALANYATGRDPFGSRFATGNQGDALAAMGFQPGLGPAGSLNIGWYNGGPAGGHTAATLPNGVNFEMGGARGNGQYGGQAVGADWSKFTDHMHLPMSGDPELSGNIFGSGGGSGGGFSYPGGGSGGSGGTGGGTTGGSGGGTSGGSGGSWQGSVVQGDAHPVFVVNWPSSQAASAPASSGAGTTPGTPATPATPGGTGVDSAYNDGETADWRERMATAGGDFAKANADGLLGDLGVGGSSGALTTLLQEIAKVVQPQIILQVSSVDEALGKARVFLQQEAMSFNRR